MTSEPQAKETREVNSPFSLVSCQNTLCKWQHKKVDSKRQQCLTVWSRQSSGCWGGQNLWGKISKKKELNREVASEIYIQVSFNLWPDTKAWVYNPWRTRWRTVRETTSWREILEVTQWWKTELLTYSVAILLNTLGIQLRPQKGQSKE